VSLRINTNVQALSTLRNLQGTMNELGTSITRLSTGLRINTASDDPAGLIISEGLRAQIKGIEQAIRNSQDAINMAKTAEGALNEVQRLLRNVRGLAVHSANTAVVDSAQLQANQTQIRSTIQSINRIAEQTQWGSRRLLDGTAGVSANVTNIGYVSSLYFGGTFNGEAVAAGPVTLVRSASAERAVVTLAATFASDTSIVGTAGAFVVNGYSFTSGGNETLQSLVQKINAMSQTTGVQAGIAGPPGERQVVLTSTEFGAQFSVNFTDPASILHTAATASDTGVNALYSVTVTTSAGPQTVAFQGGRGPRESGLRLTDLDGNSILLTETGNAGMSAPTQAGVISAGSVRFQIGANSNQAIQFSMPSVFAAQLGGGAVAGKTLADVDLTTQAGAQDAMRIIDAAITQLAQWRGDLGSFQANFLESTVRALGVAQENMAASESQIRDADIAEEMTAYTRLQILQQSGMAMLAQANQQPQNVLQLLRNQ
jgi:flagellin